jgi:hypothetical protein
MDIQNEELATWVSDLKDDIKKEVEKELIDNLCLNVVDDGRLLSLGLLYKGNVMNSMTVSKVPTPSAKYMGDP